MIILVADEGEAESLTKLSLLITLALSVCLGFGVFIYYAVHGRPSGPLLALASGIIFLVSSVYIVFLAFSNRHAHYRRMGIANVGSTVLQSLTTIGLGLAHAGGFGLLLAYFIGMLSWTFGLATSFWRQLSSILHRPMADLRCVARKYSRQPLLSAPSGLLSGLATNLPNYMLEGLFGLAVLGQYALSLRTLSAPLQIVSNACSRVFLEDAAKEFQASHSFSQSVRRTLLLVTPFAVAMTVALVCWAPPVFSWLFGASWEPAGQYARILAPSYALRLIATTICQGLYLIQKQRYELIVQILLVVSVVVPYFTAEWGNLGVSGFLLLFSGLSSAVYLFWILLVVVHSRGVQPQPSTPTP